MDITQCTAAILFIGKLSAAPLTREGRPRRHVADFETLFAAACAADDGLTDILMQEAWYSSFTFVEKDIRTFLTANQFRTAGCALPCGAPYLVMDLDSKDLYAAFRDAQRLLSYIVGTLHVPSDRVLVFFSGSKGYHILVPLGQFVWKDFQTVTWCRDAARIIAAGAGVQEDPAIYSHATRQLRLPNSRHGRTGRHKVFVTDLILNGTPDDVMDRAAGPYPFKVPTGPLPDAAKDQLKRLIFAAQEGKATSPVTAAALSVEGLEPLKMPFLPRDGACVMPEKMQLWRETLPFIAFGRTSDGHQVAEGHRNARLFAVAKDLAMKLYPYFFGCFDEKAHESAAPYAVLGIAGLTASMALALGLDKDETTRAISNATRNGLRAAGLAVSSSTKTPAGMTKKGMTTRALLFLRDENGQGTLHETAQDLFIMAFGRLIAAVPTEQRNEPIQAAAYGIAALLDEPARDRGLPPAKIDGIVLTACADAARSFEYKTKGVSSER